MRFGDVARAFGALLLAGVGVAAAACPDDPASAAAVVTARQGVASACDCAAAPSPAVFASCAKTILRDRVDGGTLPRGCRATVMRCVRASTCGAPGSVTCCRTAPNGVRCRRRRTAASCTAPRTPCAGGFGECCAECVVAGCVPTTTTTSTTAPPCDAGTAPTCGGSCSNGLVCRPGQTIQGGVATRYCACAMPDVVCGSLNSDCDFGSCPAGLSCTADFDRFDCDCRP